MICLAKFCKNNSDSSLVQGLTRMLCIFAHGFFVVEKAVGEIPTGDDRHFSCSSLL
jgi:hypothetical protein